jgi:hypothetical protein
MRCNRFEADLFHGTSERRREMLCPILWCSPCGVLMVSRAAKPISEAEAKHLRDTLGFPDWDYTGPGDESPFEPKASDWGRLDGRLVALDYSVQVD